MTDAAAGRVGLFLISERTGYQRLLADDGRRAAQKSGLALEAFSADDTAALQSSQIIKFLHAHPDERLGVIIMPVSDIGHEQALASLARKVLAKDAAWVVLNRDLETHVLQMRGEFERLPVALVAIDNHRIGRIQGAQVKAALAGKAGNVLYVTGSVLTSAARDRRAGLLELVTKPAVVSEVEGVWSTESAEKVVSRWLTSSAPVDGSLDVVACQNDPMAMGARQALHRLGRERNKPQWLNVPVMGVDGLSSEGRQLVDDRMLAATVIVPPTSGPAVELLARAWQSGAPAPPKVVLEPSPYPASR